jgi:hypothetical protein
VRILQAVGYGTLEDGQGLGGSGSGEGGSGGGANGGGAGAPGSLEGMLLAKNRWGFGNGAGVLAGSA